MRRWDRRGAAGSGRPAFPGVWSRRAALHQGLARRNLGGGCWVMSGRAVGWWLGRRVDWRGQAQGMQQGGVSSPRPLQLIALVFKVG